MLYVITLIFNWLIQFVIFFEFIYASLKITRAYICCFESFQNYGFFLKFIYIESDILTKRFGIYIRFYVIYIQIYYIGLYILTCFNRNFFKKNIYWIHGFDPTQTIVWMSKLDKKSPLNPPNPIHGHPQLIGSLDKKYILIYYQCKVFSLQMSFVIYICSIFKS